MSEIKKKLEDKIRKTVLPEVNEYIKDLNTLIKNNEDTKDDLLALEEMYSLLEELEAILKALEEDKINEEQAHEVYKNILNLIEDSKKH